VNEDVRSSPSLINQDPYASWVFKIKPEKLNEELSRLQDAKSASQKYKAIIDEWGVQCR